MFACLVINAGENFAHFYMLGKIMDDIFLFPQGGERDC
jgi:hypothetical protein